MLLRASRVNTVHLPLNRSWRYLKDNLVGTTFKTQPLPHTQPVFGCCQETRRHNVRSLHGRMFYKRRPRQVPHPKPRNYRSKWLEMAPQRKGICEKVFVMPPRKPSSGLRRVAYVRLSTGRRVLVYIPGIGHNLNVHSVVLIRGGGPRDVPGCNFRAVRGCYDLLPVKGRMTSRSKYATS